MVDVLDLYVMRVSSDIYLCAQCRLSIGTAAFCRALGNSL